MPDRHAPLRHATHTAIVHGAAELGAAIVQQVWDGAVPAALAPLVGKVEHHAYRVTDADLDALRPTHSEDALFELVVAAAVGAAERRYQAAIAAMEGA